MNVILTTIAALITATAYVDTVESFLRYLPQGLKNRIEKVQRRKAIIQRCRDGEGNICGYRLAVHQPKIRTLHLLDELLVSCRGTLCRFDVAFDFSGISRTWLEQHCVLRWRRPGPMHDEKNGVYWVAQTGRKKRSNRDIALYDDRPSKITGQLDCTHFELRFFRTQTVRREGFLRPSQLIDLDSGRLLRKHVKLVDFDDAAAKNHKRRFIRKNVKRERLKHQTEPPRRHRSQSMEDYLDQYRASRPRRVRYVYDLVIGSRVQRIKDINPKYVSGLKTISPEFLDLPDRLSWSIDCQ